MIILILAAVAVIATQLVPFIMERASRGKSAPSSESRAESAVASAPELNVEAPSRGGATKPVPPSQTAAPSLPEDSWMAQFAAAGRDTSRSPFQRKNEGLGKLFIRSRPSGAEILINGIVMPKATDWLLPVSFPAGRYVLELRKEGYNPYVTDLVIPEGVEDFEEITTVNAALRKKPEAGVQAVHKGLLYVSGQPPVLVSMIMHSTDSQSWAVIQGISGKKWVVTEGDEIEFARTTEGAVGDKQIFERIRIVKIHPDVVTIRNLLINLDYDFPIGDSSWSAHDEEGRAGNS